MNTSPHSIAVRPASSPRLASARSRILFVLFDTGRPTASLQRAFALSRVLDADLHVLRVLPETAHVHPLFPQCHIMDAVRSVERTLKAMRTTQEWVSEVLGDAEVAGCRVEVRNGAFLEQAAANAAEIGADLIVVPPREGRFGAMVTTLVRVSHVPVLVARAATSDEAIIAATNLEDAEYPVLRKAADLAAHLDARLVAVHNMTPASFGLRSAVTRPGEDAAETRRRRLARATKRLSVDTEAVMARLEDPVDAILREARDRDADMVVVGSHHRSWFDRLVSNDVATQVVNRARRSVLVTPLETAGSRAAMVLARA